VVDYWQLYWCAVHYGFRYPAALSLAPTITRMIYCKLGKGVTMDKTGSSGWLNGLIGVVIFAG
jgi:hypothetical protein